MSEPKTAEEQTAIVKISEGQDIFAIFDQLDDAAIVNELEGRLVESAVYSFDQGGKQIWGLAKTGVDWCATELEKKGYIIRDEELTYTLDPTDPTYMLFTAKVGKYFADTNKEVKVDTAIGTKRQWTKMKRQDGSVMADTFWFEKGSQKAIRNARMRLIPEETKSTIIALAKQGGRVKEVKESLPLTAKNGAKGQDIGRRTMQIKPQTARTEEEGLRGAASANVVPSPTIPPAKTEIDINKEKRELGREIHKTLGMLGVKTMSDSKSFLNWLFAYGEKKNKRYCGIGEDGEIHLSLGDIEDMKVLLGEAHHAFTLWQKETI